MRTRVNRLLKSVAANARLVADLRWALLLALPALWCVVEYRGGLGFLERRTVDWRFQVRGEKPSPVKIVYVDVDSLSLSRIGGWPWNRGHFARVSAALLGEAKVKAIGFDFVFSDTGLSESVDRTKMRNGNVEFGRFLETRPPIALAAAYGGWQFLDINRDTVRERMLPLLDSDKRRVEEMEPPEIPAVLRRPAPDLHPRYCHWPDRHHRRRHTRSARLGPEQRAAHVLPPVAGTGPPLLGPAG
jgi:adenylate cyclase